MPAHTYKFNVAMSCGGCSGAVNRVLGKLEGVEKYEADHNEKRADVSNVLVETSDSLDYDTVLEKIKKTGKAVNWGEADGVRKEVTA